MSATPRRVAVVFGTRPEAIKVAPVILALRAAQGMRPQVVVTGQHRLMLRQVLDLFGIQPDLDLDILTSGQSLTQIAVRALAGLEQAFDVLRPDVVVVQGDTTTTMAGALAGFYARIPVAHLEAGLRTFDRFSPYPEEVNRQLVSTLASLHMVPTPTARSNLTGEGVHPSDIVVTGNTVIDALLWAVGRRVPYCNPSLEALDQDPRRVVLVTTHRRESWGTRMADVAQALRNLVDSEPNVVLVLPMHLNPTVRSALMPHLANHERVLLCEPLPYGSFARLLQRADLVLTDSGGIQEEAPSLAKPVLVLRDTTERPEAVAAGVVELVGTDPVRIVGAARALLHDPARYEAMATACNPYGDGLASQRVIAALARLLGLSETNELVPEFVRGPIPDSGAFG